MIDLNIYTRFRCVILIAQLIIGEILLFLPDGNTHNKTLYKLLQKRKLINVIAVFIFIPKYV